jgi:hypothetical protein
MIMLLIRRTSELSDCSIWRSSSGGAPPAAFLLERFDQLVGVVQLEFGMEVRHDVDVATSVRRLARRSARRPTAAAFPCAGLVSTGTIFIWVMNSTSSSVRGGAPGRPAR